jgi:hypothetical protein
MLIWKQEETYCIPESIDYDENGDFLSAVVIKNTWASIIQYRLNKLLAGVIIK